MTIKDFKILLEQRLQYISEDVEIVIDVTPNDEFPTLKSPITLNVVKELNKDVLWIRR